MKHKCHKVLANEYTEDCPQKLSKPQLIAIVLCHRDETKATINSLSDEVKATNTNFQKLKADVGIGKIISNLLTKKTVETEQQRRKNDQKSRREWLEIAGIPTFTPQPNLEENAGQIFEAIGVSVDKNDIDYCHRLRMDERSTQGLQASSQI